MTSYTEAEFETYKRVKQIVDEEEAEEKQKTLEEYLNKWADIDTAHKFKYSIDYWQETWGGCLGAIWTYTIINEETDEVIEGQASEPYGKHQERHDDDYHRYAKNDDDDFIDIDKNEDKVPKDLLKLDELFRMDGESLKSLIRN